MLVTSQLKRTTHVSNQPAERTTHVSNQPAERTTHVSNQPAERTTHVSNQPANKNATNANANLTTIPSTNTSTNNQPAETYYRC